MFENRREALVPLRQFYGRIVRHVIGALSLDRGREDRLPGLPSLQTVRADLPHTALQSVVLRRTDWHARPLKSRMASSPRAARKTPDLHILHHLDHQAASTRSARIAGSASPYLDRRLRVA